MLEKDLDKEILRQFAWMYKDVGFLEKTHAEDIRDEKGRHLATERGKPDLVGCLKGRFLAFEDKMRPNIPTDAQWAYLRKVDMVGGFCGMFVVAGTDCFFVPPEYIANRDFSWRDTTMWVRLGSHKVFNIQPAMERAIK